MSTLDRYASDLVNQAYALAHRCGSSGRLSRIEIAELLIREGIPDDLAYQAADDTILEVIKTRKREGRQRMTYGLFILALGAVLMVASMLVFRSMIVVPVGIMVFGAGLAFAGLSRSQKNTL